MTDQVAQPSFRITLPYGKSLNRSFPLAALIVALISASMIAAYTLRPGSKRSASTDATTQATTPHAAQGDVDPSSGVISAASAPESTTARTPPHLRAQRLEATLTTPIGLSLRAARREYATEADFDRLLDTLRDGYHGDPEASETRRLFERQIGTAFSAGHTGITLDRIDCGLSVCAAKFNGRQTASMEFLGTLMNSPREGSARIYSSNIRIVPPASGGDRVGYRVIFATDPAMATLIDRR